MIHGIIFDMDGLLIDSEPLWIQAERHAFQKVGIELTMTQTSETTGLRVDEVVEHWYLQYPWDTSDYTKESLAQEIVEEVKKLIREEGTAKKGVIQILKFLSTKTTNIAIASSSEYSIIQEVVERLDIEKYFPIIHSAEEEQYGKPHPAVYLSACKKIGVIPEECITFEDSLNGVISAKSAKITCIAVPEDVNKGNPKFAIADIILDSLEDFGEEEWKKLSK